MKTKETKMLKDGDVQVIEAEEVDVKKSMFSKQLNVEEERKPPPKQKVIYPPPLNKKSNDDVPKLNYYIYTHNAIFKEHPYMSFIEGKFATLYNQFLKNKGQKPNNDKTFLIGEFNKYIQQVGQQHGFVDEHGFYSCILYLMGYDSHLRMSYKDITDTCSKLTSYSGAFDFCKKNKQNLYPQTFVSPYIKDVFGFSKLNGLVDNIIATTCFYNTLRGEKLDSTKERGDEMYPYFPVHITDKNVLKNCILKHCEDYKNDNIILVISINEHVRELYMLAKHMKNLTINMLYDENNTSQDLLKSVRELIKQNSSNNMYLHKTKQFFK